MKVELITAHAWARMTAAARRASTRSHIAVAYFGTGASKMLPLRTGSTLIVDMSLRAVKSGQTKPSEVLALIRQGVEVHSVENLHAKVFVLGDRTFVGSNNVSNNSASRLIEAAVFSEDRKLATECKAFVLGLRGELVTPTQAAKLQLLWRPPKFEQGQHQKPREPSLTPEHQVLWVVPLEKSTFDEADLAAEAAGMKSAKRRLTSKRRFSVEDFCWSGAPFLDRLRPNELLIQVTDYGDNRLIAAAASRVLAIKRYKVGRQSRGIVYLESPIASRGKNVERIVKALGNPAGFLRKLSNPTVVRNRPFVHALLHLWPTTS